MLCTLWHRRRSFNAVQSVALLDMSLFTQEDINGQFKQVSQTIAHAMLIADSYNKLRW